MHDIEVNDALSDVVKGPDKPVTKLPLKIFSKHTPNRI